MLKTNTLLLFLFPLFLFGQSNTIKIEQLNKELKGLKEKEVLIQNELEGLKLKGIQADLKQYGFPKTEAGEEIINHAAMSLVYSEEHEQAKWVAHIVIPDIIKGTVGRSNDFRQDPQVKTSTAEEKDYFLKYKQEDGSYEYDGFGYDRGHLAPSADFRWSMTALSESYFYSNMSPQVADFNRGKWAELEGLVRGYMYNNPETQLYVVTGPILKKDLPIIERSVNRVSIPKLYFKAILDLKNKRSIGFIMPNQLITYPIESFAVSIDKIEEETGLDLFHNIPDEIENEVETQRDAKAWFPPKAQDDVEPIYPPSLPPSTFNTIQSKIYMGKGRKVNVCGTVVSTKLSRKGNVFINLDKKFPNQVFTITIFKKDLLNFSFTPDEDLIGKTICAKGIVTSFNGTPTMNLKKEEDIRYYGEDGVQ